jgi:HKD family nuclease
MPSPSAIQVLSQPLGSPPVGEVVVDALGSGTWTAFRAVVAFAKESGVRYLAKPLHDFLATQGNHAVITVGLDLDGTSLEGLQGLWRTLNGRGELLVFKEGQGGPSRTFHPKVFLFESPTRALVIVGSSNLTQGGLFMNHEAAVAVTLDLADSESAATLAACRSAIDPWQTVGPACLRVDASVIQRLYAEGDLLPERAIATARRVAAAVPRSGSSARTVGRSPLFGSSGAVSAPPVPPPLPPMAPPAVIAPVAPPPPSRTRPRRRLAASTPSPGATPRGVAITAAGAIHHALVIEVRPHHNGEIFLSKIAVDSDPGFFGFPFSGWTIPKRRGNPPYPMAQPDPQVEIFVYDQSGRLRIHTPHSLNLVYYTPKSEIRITIPPEPLNAIPQMSILAMTRNPRQALDYQLDFYPPGCTDPRAQRLARRLVHQLPSGGAAIRRRYGWA